MLDSICFMSTCSSFTLGVSVSCLYLNMFLSCAEVGVFVVGSVFSRSALNTLSYTLVPDNARSSLPLKRLPASTTALSVASAGYDSPGNKCCDFIFMVKPYFPLVRMNIDIQRRRIGR